MRQGSECKGPGLGVSLSCGEPRGDEENLEERLTRGGVLGSHITEGLEPYPERLLARPEAFEI